MCIFKRKTLPHPYEQPDYSRTIDNVNISDVAHKWLDEWQVAFPNFWLIDVTVQLSLEYNYPGLAFSGEKKILLRPEWANAGTLAHEAAHISYSLLTDEQKQEFSQAYNPLKDKGLIKFLYSKNPYGLVSDIEGHAEIYRYLCPDFPRELHRFYPKLIKEE